MLKIYLLIILLIFYGCKKDKLVPDIISGMVCNISLDGNAYDSKQNISGALNNVISTSNRNGEPNKAMLFAQLDSSFVNMGDFSNYSFNYLKTAILKKYYERSSIYPINSFFPFPKFELNKIGPSYVISRPM